jgi:hypothetical protein
MIELLIGSLKRPVLRFLVVAVLAPLAFVISGTGPAAAAPIPGAVFAGQVKTWGLSSAQAQELQAKVDSYLAELGGTQVAANEISLGSGATIRVALPRAPHTRSLTAAVLANDCPYYYVCAYHYPNFEGDRLMGSACGSQNAFAMPWAFAGSWRNNQTPGTWGVFWMCNGQQAAIPAAWSANNSYNWTPVCWVQPCEA